MLYAILVDIYNLYKLCIHITLYYIIYIDFCIIYAFTGSGVCSDKIRIAWYIKSSTTFILHTERTTNRWIFNKYNVWNRLLHMFGWISVCKNEYVQWSSIHIFDFRNRKMRTFWCNAPFPMMLSDNIMVLAFSFVDYENNNVGLFEVLTFPKGTPKQNFWNRWKNSLFGFVCVYVCVYVCVTNGDFRKGVLIRST